MPTYQYACTVASCGHRFEAVQTFTEPALTVCPMCDGGLRKVFSPVGVVFKGSGFYRNDSRGSDSKKSATPDKDKTEKSPTGSTEKKSESTTTSNTSSSEKSTSSTSTSTSKAAAS